MLCVKSFKWPLDPGEVFLLGIKQEVRGKAPGGLGHWIKNRKGAEKTYYFLSINIHSQGSLTRASSKFMHHLNGLAKMTINI